MPGALQPQGRTFSRFVANTRHRVTVLLVTLTSTAGLSPDLTTPTPGTRTPGTSALICSSQAVLSKMWERGGPERGSSWWARASARLTLLGCLSPCCQCLHHPLKSEMLPGKQQE